MVITGGIGLFHTASTSSGLTSLSGERIHILSFRVFYAPPGASLWLHRSTFSFFFSFCFFRALSQIMLFVILLPNVLSVSQPFTNTFRSSSPLLVGLSLFGLYRCDQSTVPLGSFFCPYFILACGGSRRSTPFHFSSCFDPARNVKCLRLCFGFSGAYLDIFDSPFGSHRFFCAVFERGLLSRSYRSVVLSSPPDSLIASRH